MRYYFGSGSNPAQTRVGYEEIRKRALQHHDPDAFIGLEFAAEPVEILRQDLVQKIDRGVIDADECDSGIESEPEALLVGISHGIDSISVTVRDGRSVHAKRSMSSGRSCEMGLRHATGRPYESFIFLLEELSRPHAG